MRQTHFTMTGFYAGAVYCGRERDSTVADYCHVPYVATADELAPDFRVRICPDCLRIAFGEETHEPEPKHEAVRLFDPAPGPIPGQMSL